MYDAIMVGARCAGAPTALLLARKGYKVLMVDRSVFPSDMAFSNHFMHQAGSACLKRWGLLERLMATGCPPITEDFFDYGAFSLTGPVPPADGVNTAFAPRRIVLDPLLAEAAVEAGAELRLGGRGVRNDRRRAGDLPRGIHDCDQICICLEPIGARTSEHCTDQRRSVRLFASAKFSSLFGLLRDHGFRQSSDRHSQSFC